MGVFNQRFEVLFLFPRAGALGCSPELRGLFHSPAVPPSLSMHECGAAGSASYLLAGPASCSLAVSPLCPGCPSPPLLPVWMNVSSLSPWLSDFHTVRFSVSSGGFLFLNCCCPSFGCVRRHSVSTYASILARSPLFKLFSISVHLNTLWTPRRLSLLSLLPLFIFLIISVFINNQALSKEFFMPQLIWSSQQPCEVGTIISILQIQKWRHIYCRLLSDFQKESEIAYNKVHG